MQTNTQTTMDMRTRHGDTKDKTLEKVDLKLDKYLVEGKSRLLYIRTMLDLQYRHHLYVH